MELNYSPRPYQVFQESDSFSFITDCQVEYNISFADVHSNWIDGNPELSAHCKLFTIKKKSENCSLKNCDTRIRDTVCFLIDLFLKTNPVYFVFFIADDADKRSSNRLKKFSRWYNSYTNQYNHTYIFKSIVLPAGETKVRMGYIYETDNELGLFIENSVETFVIKVHNK